jgi:hypothetical protein
MPDVFGLVKVLVALELLGRLVGYALVAAVIGFAVCLAWKGNR